MNKKMIHSKHIINSTEDFHNEFNKKRIVLISLYEYDSFPIRILHSILKKNGFNVYSVFFKVRYDNRTMDYATKKEIDLLVRLLTRLNPVLVGINVRSTFFKLSADITKNIKDSTKSGWALNSCHCTIEYID